MQNLGSIQNTRFRVAIERLTRAMRSPEFTRNAPPIFGHYGRGRLYEDAHLAFVAEAAALYGAYLEVDGAVLVDVGAGLGLQSVMFALLGATKVIAYDVTPEMHDGLRHLLRAFDPPLPVEPRLADWVSEPAPPDSADAILMQESISHIRDTNKAISAAARALRSGGRLLISDANNAWWIPSVIKSWRSYLESEYGSGQARPGARRFDREGHHNARKRIIAEEIPGLDDRALTRLARRTRGLYAEGLRRAAHELHSQGYTHVQADFWSRNPYTGEFPELLINPGRMRRRLMAVGLRCEFLSPPRMWRRGGLGPVVNAGKRFLSTLSRLSPQWLRPLFGSTVVIRAVKA